LIQGVLRIGVEILPPGLFPSIARERFPVHRPKHETANHSNVMQLLIGCWFSQALLTVQKPVIFFITNFDANNSIMIQRQQTLWLILAAVTSFLTYRFPFYTGNILENNVARYEELDGGSNLFLLVLTGAAVFVGAVAIFMFKDRKRQFKLAIGGLVISVVILILYMTQLKKFTNGRFSLTCLLVLGMIIGFVMAARGIWKDEKLVKSLDKLR
jgi:hypothetical protein